ncbi:MAG: hypothetical protein HZB26_20830 [Candidatus Hydrogenedentes bacterium]|nr:hypothetical protein [Candidatus Hydrogenedentota bacterium]
MTVVALLAVGCHKEQIDIALNLHPGDERTAVRTTRSKDTVVVKGTPLKAQAISEIHYEFKVARVDNDGNTMIDAVISSTTFDESTDTGRGVIIPFQNARGRSPIGEIMDKLARKSFSFVLSPKVEVLSMKGTAEIRKALETEVDLATIKDSEAWTPAQRKEFAARYLDYASEESFKANIEELFHVLPPGPATTGTSWSLPPIKDTNADGLLTRGLAIKETTPTRVVIHEQSTIAPIEGSKAIVTGTQEGTIKIDPVTGLSSRQEYKLLITGTNATDTSFHDSSEESTIIEMY